MKTERAGSVLSGVQPSGNLHIGNYLGALELGPHPARLREHLLHRRSARHHGLPEAG
jgi:hypothetical protein